jgi:hypothetical protein
MEGRVGGDGFLKCADMILKKSKPKISKRKHKEPPMLPLNGGFTVRGWLMPFLNNKTLKP